MGANEDIMNKRRIAVLGSRSVGKSSLVIQYIHKNFEENYHPTIEHTYGKSIKFKGEEFDCDIIDTAGQDEFSILNSKYSIGIHGYVLVYSVASRNSLEIVKIVHDKILEFSGLEKVACVIVGAKNDTQPSSRQVSSAEAEAVAKSLGCAWIETSAKKNINIAKVFELCIAEIENRGIKNVDDKGGCVVM